MQPQSNSIHQHQHTLLPAQTNNIIQMSSSLRIEQPQSQSYAHLSKSKNTQRQLQACDYTWRKTKRYRIKPITHTANNYPTLDSMNTLRTLIKSSPQHYKRRVNEINWKQQRMSKSKQHWANIHRLQTNNNHGHLFNSISQLRAWKLMLMRHMRFERAQTAEPANNYHEGAHTSYTNTE